MKRGLLMKILTYFSLSAVLVVSVASTNALPPVLKKFITREETNLAVEDYSEKLVRMTADIEKRDLVAIVDNDQLQEKSKRIKNYLDKFYQKLDDKQSIEVKKAPRALFLAVLNGEDTPKTHKIFEELYDNTQPVIYQSNPFKRGLSDLEKALSKQEEEIEKKESAYEACGSLQKDEPVRKKALEELKLARLKKARFDKMKRERVSWLEKEARFKKPEKPMGIKERLDRAELLVRIDPKFSDFLRIRKEQDKSQRNPEDGFKRYPYWITDKNRHGELVWKLRYRPEGVYETWEGKLEGNLISSFYLGQEQSMKGELSLGQEQALKEEPEVRAFAHHNAQWVRRKNKLGPAAYQPMWGKSRLIRGRH